jgi:hypothetical protein
MPASEHRARYAMSAPKRAASMLPPVTLAAPT